MIYSLENSEIKIEVNSFGAELKSLVLLEDKLEYLWQGNPDFWNRSSPVLFPIVGKLLDNTYTFNNKQYSMSQHGFARDKEFLLVKQNKNSLKFLLKSDDKSFEIYPFSFELYISYEIKNRKLKVSYDVLNKSEDKMYFSIGAHPAFNWPLTQDKNESQEDYYFEFEALEDDTLQRLPLLENGISSSKEDVIMENKKLAISKSTFKKDALIFKTESKTNKLNTIKLKNSKNDKFIQMDFEGFSHLGLWSKPSGAPFVCIEPWHGIADFIEHNQKLEDKEGIIKLEKDDTFSSSYFISI